MGNKDKYYYDTRLGEVVKNLNIEYLAPELFYEIRSTGTDAKRWIETWFVGNANCLVVAYDDVDIKNKFVAKKREAMEKRYSTRLLCLTAYAIPEYAFKKMVEGMNEDEEV